MRAKAVRTGRAEAESDEGTLALAGLLIREWDLECRQRGGGAIAAAMAAHLAAHARSLPRHDLGLGTPP